MKNRKKKFTIPLYGNTLVVIQTDDLSGVQKKYGFTPIEGCNGITFVSKDKKGRPDYVVAFKGKTTAGIIAHESLHVVASVFDHVQAYLDMNNEEPQCYLLGWIVDKIHSVVKTK